MAATTLLTVFCADRYLRKPSAWRLALLGLALGCALASKHTAVFVSVIVLLQFAMFAWLEKGSISSRKLAGLGAAWICARVIGLLILWSTYHFRYSALPGKPEAFHVEQILENDERSPDSSEAKPTKINREGLIFGLPRLVRFR